MKFLGIFLVLLCTSGGFVMAAHFNMTLISGVMRSMFLPALPGELVIILGIAISSFLIANTPDQVKFTLKSFRALKQPLAHSKDDYLQMLGLLYSIFKLARTKGWLAMEQHIEDPENSELFNQFPKFSRNHEAVLFVCDYLRIISLGNENPHELEALMDLEIETIEHHHSQPGHALQTLADSLPALGIVAAVLGIIKTMASIAEPPEVLGKLIGAALTGTFLGVWLGYAFVSPIALAILGRAESEVMYYKSIKVGILAYLQGAAPQVSIEFARKLLPSSVQPEFLELEDYVNQLPSPL
ncbi:MAG: flagellar motor stator protein MotA [Alphaproteobacteria bacterium]|nr:flagellar motor stator protein MotA [Alphaproteobacteria bacterium]